MASPIEKSAILSVARGCGFGALAIVCAMVGFSYDPVAALKFGGFALLFTCAILILKAVRSETVGYRKTEAWLMLPVEFRPPPVVAQQVIGRARRRALLVFARLNAAFAAGCFVAALLVQAWTAG